MTGCLRILTNLPASQIYSNFWQKFLPVVSPVIKLNAEDLICVMNADSFVNIEGETAEPAVVASLETAENHGCTLNHPAVVAAVGDFFDKEFNVPKKRIFMTFYNLSPQKSVLGDSSAVGDIPYPRPVIIPRPSTAQSTEE